MGSGYIDDIETFRGLHGDGSEVVYRKSIGCIDPLAARFLEMSSLVVVSSRDQDGNMDVSPRGDPPGSMRVLSPGRLALPDRPGNRRADTFTNVLQDAHVGLLCLVPGIDETLRISGRGRISRDADLLASMEVRGHVPRLALVVDVDEVFIHCGKALKRGRIWDPAAYVDRSTYPSMGQVMHAHGRLDEVGVSETEMHRVADEDYRENVY